jgi:hypothetical protein
VSMEIEKENLEKELLEMVMKAPFGVTIWFFPKYKFRIIALISKEIGNA